MDHGCEILGDFCGGYGTGLLERKIRHGCSIKQTIRRRLGKALPDKLRAIKLPSPSPSFPRVPHGAFLPRPLVCLNKPAKENNAFQRLPRENFRATDDCSRPIDPTVSFPLFLSGRTCESFPTEERRFKRQTTRSNLPFYENNIDSNSFKFQIFFPFVAARRNN